MCEEVVATLVATTCLPGGGPCLVHSRNLPLQHSTTEGELARAAALPVDPIVALDQVTGSAVQVVQALLVHTVAALRAALTWVDQPAWSAKPEQRANVELQRPQLPQ